MELSEYELERRKKIAENEQVLKELGLFEQTAIRALGGTKPAPKKEKRKKPSERGKEERKEERKEEKKGETPKELADPSARRVTRSAVRSKKQEEEKKNPPVAKKEIDESVPFVVKDGEENEIDRSSIGNVFGSIPGIEVGHVWESRMECSRDKVHRPPVAGIHGSEEEGCYSLAMSGTGEYNDDLDWGDSFTYTGEGGRDLRGTKDNPKNLRTAVQSKDQTLTRGNLALSRNFYNRKPVRVIRGYKLQSSFAPPEGYRYDGLYTVEKFWETKGTSGHLVYKYALKRVPGQPIPWVIYKDETKEEKKEENEKEEKEEGKEEKVKEEGTKKAKDVPNETKSEAEEQQ